MNKIVPNKRLNYRKVAHPNYVLSRWFLNFRFAYLLKKPKPNRLLFRYGSTLHFDACNPLLMLIDRIFNLHACLSEAMSYF